MLGIQSNSETEGKLQHCQWLCRRHGTLSFSMTELIQNT